MRAFQATGSYNASRGSYRKIDQTFKVQVAAADEKEAVEKVLSDLGSKHRVKRVNVTFTEVRPMEPAEVTDPVVKYQLGEER
jgi:large subunit ribosomal protein LX